MQDTQTDSEQCQRVGVDEQFIKFRPSPNFKNMKKFLKMKIDCKETRNLSPPHIIEPATLEEEEKKKSTVQPPLPLDPPPPDSPPIQVTIKKEIEDTEYQSGAEDTTGVNSHTDNLITEFKTDEPEKPAGKEVCRDFIRGTCTRSGCKYAHEYDVSHLVGVYVFCRNFQNSVCNHPNCKYVHATVFEEQRFYRTGVLPAHATSHHKKVNMLQPPPPPPPPPPPEESQPEIPQKFTNPPPPLQAGDKVLPLVTPVTNIQLGTIEGTLKKLASRTSPIKHKWNDDFTRSPRENENNEHLIKKCKHCEVTELRLQYERSEFDKLLWATKEVNKNIDQLNKKHNKLETVLRTLLKTPCPSKPLSSVNGLASSLNDKDLLSVNRTRLSNLMAKLLLQFSNEDQPLTLDST